MSRSSPGVARVAAILNFIADHPGQAFALTDLVRALKLSRATCHALLTGLVDVGYLYRTSDKTYVLGPTLAAIGQTAAQHFSPLQVAQPEMRVLADRFDVVCGAYFLEGDIMHLRDRAASLSHVGYPVPLGTRMTLRSTQAGVFFAHAPKEAAAWLERTSASPSAANLALLDGSMAAVRADGFLAIVRKPGVEPNLTATDAVLALDTDELPVTPLPQFDDDRAYPVAAIMAPVHDGRDKAGIALVMAGFQAAMSGAQMREAGTQLAAASRRISGFLTGQSHAAA